MTPQMVVSIGREALILTLMIAGPMLLFGLIVGLAVALFQAVTQIQEMTLTFIPKIIAILVICSLTAPFIGAVIYSFAEQVYARIEVGF